MRAGKGPGVGLSSGTKRTGVGLSTGTNRSGVGISSSRGRVSAPRGVPRGLNYRSSSYTAQRAPTQPLRADGRGFKTKPAGRYVGNSRGKGPVTFQPGLYVNSGRDRGTSFVRYVAPTGPGNTLKETEEPKKKEEDTAPTPEPTPPTPRPERSLRIRESAARRTAISRGRRARGSRRSARVGNTSAQSRAVSRSIGGLNKPSRSGLNV